MDALVMFEFFVYSAVNCDVQSKAEQANNERDGKQNAEIS